MALWLLKITIQKHLLTVLCVLQLVSIITNVFLLMWVVLQNNVFYIDNVFSLNTGFIFEPNFAFRYTKGWLSLKQCELDQPRCFSSKFLQYLLNTRNVLISSFEHSPFYFASGTAFGTGDSKMNEKKIFSSGS